VMQLDRPQQVNDQLMGMSNRRSFGLEAVDLILWKKLLHSILKIQRGDTELLKSDNRSL